MRERDCVETLTEGLFRRMSSAMSLWAVGEGMRTRRAKGEMLEHAGMLW